jgi:Flp pilus assembly protein TadG
MAFMRGLKRSVGAKKAGGRARRSGRRLRACLGAGEEGQSVLELAFVLPVLMTVLMGIFWIGWTYNNQIVLTQAVGAGGAYVNAIGQGTLNGITDPCAGATTEIVASAVNLNTSNLTISYYVNGTAVSLTGGGCPSQLSNFQTRGNTVTVQASYPCSMAALSGLGSLISGTFFSSGCRMTQKVSEYIY